MEFFFVWTLLAPFGRIYTQLVPFFLLHVVDRLLIPNCTPGRESLSRTTCHFQINAASLVPGLAVATSVCVGYLARGLEPVTLLTGKEGRTTPEFGFRPAETELSACLPYPSAVPECLLAWYFPRSKWP
ncbi:hypothetical protein B0T24DRAFT_225245 [Lasiosphaeria ovina]|uniref:Uncharacterized protein n=1 Tax=Lasiosphaeria ovina TaxID=92902 RepID=A0AAE0NBL7_9PEZI|nr:hypothetical protein B0T24DRAFT_225245 [Lasiosphaeria ovina]